MDLSTIKADTRTISILHPGTGTPVGLNVHIVGLFDPRVKAVQNRLKNKALRKRDGKVSAEFIDDAADETLISTITGWDWVKDADGEIGSFNGEQLEYSEKNAALLLDGFPPMRDQIDAELANESEFFMT